MTKLSKRNLDPKEMGYYINNLWNAFVLMDSKEEIRQFVKDLFTHTEYKMFAKRLEIARRLILGQTYEQIREALNVSDRPINFINNLLANGGPGMRIADKKLSDLEVRYKRLAEERQAYLERRKRRKSPAETVLLEVTKMGVGALSKAVKKRIKHKSVEKNFPV